MVMKVFTIYDSKVGAYLPPFMMHTVGEAERALKQHIDDPEHNFCKYAEDFTLFELGTWDSNTGMYDVHATPHSISLLSHYKRPVKEV